MSADSFHIVTHWRVAGTIAEVVAVLDDPKDLPCWWPAVYLDVVQVKPGGEHNVGAEYDLFTKGYLPYTLRWRLRLAEVISNEQFHVEAVSGDLVGKGVWKLSQNDLVVEIDTIGRCAPRSRYSGAYHSCWPRFSRPITVGPCGAAKRISPIELRRRRATTSTNWRPLGRRPDQHSGNDADFRERS